MSLILGISAFYHDSAATIIRDGKIVAAAQEERFTRKKHDSSYPENAVAYCLGAAGATLGDVDYVAFYDKPFLKFERLLETYVAKAPRGFTSFRMAMPIWLREKLFQRKLLSDLLRQLDEDFDAEKKLLFAEHHVSHAASAYYPSPFDHALVLTLDGVGEWATTTVGVGRGNSFSIHREIHFPHSLGLLYSAFTYYTGFRVNSGEYKLMGLAPYGEPKYAQQILDHLIDVKEDGSFRLNMKYFEYATGLTMTNRHFDALFGQPARTPENQLTQFHMDIAASIQKVLEEVLLKMTRALHKDFAIDNLCMAGGVALNCVANGVIQRDGRFKNLWIQPAAGDAGGSLGAALAAYHGYLGKPRLDLPSAALDQMAGSYLGPEYNDTEIADRLKAAGAVFEMLSPEETITRTASDLAGERAVGWFQGRMEFGPRALGGRSILGDPRSPSMQKNLNLKVKFRESFRPFAPSVLSEKTGEWFEQQGDSPYMLLVADVKKEKQIAMNDEQQKLFGIEKLNIARSSIPAVTHVDYSARIQTVHKRTNPRYHALISEFEKLTGCPVIVNTSFNVRGEPIVCTPEDAFRCFMGTGLDTLVCGNVYLRKEDQDANLAQDYKNAFELD